MKTLMFHIFIDLVTGISISKNLPIVSFEKPLKTGEVLPQPNELLGIRTIYENPILVLLKTGTPKNEFVGYFLRNGIKNIYDDPNTRALHEVMYSDAEKIGYVTRPEKIPISPLEECDINKLEFSKNKNINLLRFHEATTKGAYNFCYLIIQKNKDLPGKPVEYFRNLDVKEMPIPIPAAQIPTFVPPFNSDGNHHQPLNVLPLYPADTFPYIPNTEFPGNPSVPVS